MNMSEPIKILIADDSDETRELLKQLISLSDSLVQFGEARTGMEVLEILKTSQPDVVLMDINMPGLTGLETTEKVSRLYPNLVVIMMSVQGETEYLKKAMMSGAREYLIKPFNLELLEETVLATVEKEKERQLSQDISLRQKDLLGNSKIHVCFSTKGGVGKSVLALNMALLMAQTDPGRVALVDFDLQFGDLGILTNTKSGRTVSEAVEEGAIGDPELLKTYMHSIGGVDLLLAPKRPEMAEYLGEKHVQTILQTLKKMYRYIIVDTAVNFSEVNLSLLDTADRIHMVSTMDLLALKNTRLGLDVLRSLHHLDAVQLLINRSGRNTEITPSDVEKALGLKVSGFIADDDKTVMESVNQGVPVVLDRKGRGSKFHKTMEAYAKNQAAF